MTERIGASSISTVSRLLRLLRSYSGVISRLSETTTPLIIDTARSLRRSPGKHLLREAFNICPA